MDAHTLSGKVRNHDFEPFTTNRDCRKTICFYWWTEQIQFGYSNCVWKVKNHDFEPFTQFQIAEKLFVSIEWLNEDNLDAHIVSGKLEVMILNLLPQIGVAEKLSVSIDWLKKYSLDALIVSKVRTHDFEPFDQIQVAEKYLFPLNDWINTVWMLTLRLKN